MNGILIQVSPGKDYRVSSKLGKLFGNSVKCYLGLGKYDLVVVGRRKDFSVIEEYRNNRFRNILDWHILCGTAWKFDCGDISQNAHKPILGISCIKLDPYAIESGSITNIEEQIAEKIANSGTQVYCGLGNYEIVCLVPSDDFHKLSKQVLKIKRVLAENERAILLDMTTIPSFDPKILSEREFANLRMNKFTFNLLLSLRLGFSHKLQQKLKELFKNARIASIYGFHDVWIRLSCSFGDFIKSVMKLRKIGKKLGIYSTYTAIEQFQKAFSFEVPSMRRSMRSTRFSGARKESLSHFLHLLDISKCDPLTRTSFRNHEGLFKDIEKLVDRCQRFKKKKKIVEYWGFVEKYDTIIDCLRLVFLQRYAGLLPGNLLGYKTLGLEPHGGIQRAVLAIESVPIFLFKSLNIDWKGFCLFGYSHRYYRTECGLINIPEVYRVRPEMWWGIYHELGHEALSKLKDTKINSFIKRSIDRLTTRAYKRSKKDKIKISKKTILYDFTDFVEEIFAEMFGFYFGFRNDWELYKEKVWNYFAKEFPINFKHIARAILVFFTLGPGYELRKGGPVYPDEIKRYIAVLEHIFISKGRKRWTLEQKDRATDLIVNFDFIADKLANYLQGFHLDPVTNSDIQNINSELKDGKIIHDANPDQIIFALMHYREPISMAQRVAAIVTLYGAYWKLISE